MNEEGQADLWSSAEAYEPYLGRWSRLVAREFIAWLEVPAGSRWLDVGSGTGVLAQAILENAAPIEVVGVDSSPAFVEHAQTHVLDFRARFELGNAQRLSFEAGLFDATVSGLLLNFVLEPELATLEMARVTRVGGVVAAYVWDYADRMELIRAFWDAAATLDPVALILDEGQRFAPCNADALRALFEASSLADIEVRAIEVPTVFRDFDDYWKPFLGGQGPGPRYAMSLSEDRRAELRELIRRNLPVKEDGSIPLTARAWGVRGRR